MKYHFYRAGSIPYIAGTYANVIVEVDDATNAVLSITPLVPVAPAAPSQPLLPPEADAASNDPPQATEHKES